MCVKGVVAHMSAVLTTLSAGGGLLKSWNPYNRSAFSQAKVVQAHKHKIVSHR